MPLMYYETNMRSTINILEAMRVHDVKTFVFSSSAMVYKTLPPGELADENGELDPSDPYPGVKAQVERMCIDYTKADSTWRMAMLRYFRAAGADSSGLLGEKAMQLQTSYEFVSYRFQMKSRSCIVVGAHT